MQMRSKMWTYKHWQYLDDEEKDVAGIVTQSMLTYLKSTKIDLWKNAYMKLLYKPFSKIDKKTAVNKFL